MPRLGCLVTFGFLVDSRASELFTRFLHVALPFLSCFLSAPYVNAAAELSSHGLVVLLNHGKVC